MSLILPSSQSCMCVCLTYAGPALLFAVAIAGQVPHSEVLVATDGLSNVGLGALDTGDRKQNVRFYSQRLVSFAKEQNNTSVSVIGLQGEECGLSALAPLAQQTAGDVTIVRPLELQRRMRMIIDNPVCRRSLIEFFSTRSTTPHHHHHHHHHLLLLLLLLLLLHQFVLH
jgi:hypothetical protein